MKKTKVDNTKIYLHVGLCKTYTTSFQLSIFNKITELINIDYYYYGQNNNFKAKKLHSFFTNFSNSQNFFFSKTKKNLINNINSSILISNENLSTLNFKNTSKNIYNSINKLKKIFNKRTIVILTIRNPITYINSVYNETFKEGQLMDKEQFFKYFRFDKFSYSKIINKYRYNFDEVVVLKCDDNHVVKNLLIYFNIKLKYLRLFRLNHEKKGMSNFSINVCIFFDKFLKIFKTDLNHYLKYVRDDINKKNKLLAKILDITLVLRKLDSFFNLKNKKKISKNDFNFGSLIKEYNKLKGINVYKKY